MTHGQEPDVVTVGVGDGGGSSGGVVLVVLVVRDGFGSVVPEVLPPAGGRPVGELLDERGAVVGSVVAPGAGVVDVPVGVPPPTLALAGSEVWSIARRVADDRPAVDGGRDVLGVAVVGGCCPFPC